MGCAKLYHETSLIGAHRIYGNYCGFTGGQVSKFRTEIEINIKNQEIEKINKWVFSLDRIKKAYAAKALIRLHIKDSIELTINQKRKILRLKRSSRKINTCGGCVYKHESLKDALAKFEIK